LSLCGEWRLVGATARSVALARLIVRNRTHNISGTKMQRSARPQLGPPPRRRRLHCLQATPVIRCTESSCTLPVAPPCAVGARAAVTIFRGGHNNKFADWCKSSPPSTWTPASLIHTHKHQHLRPLRLRPLRLRPSCLQTPTPSALAPSALAPSALVLSWSSTAVAQRHDLAMHEKPHYQRFLLSDRRHLCPHVGPAQQRGSQRQYWMSVARHRWPERAVTCIRHQRQSLPLCWATTIRGDSPSVPPVHVGGHSNWRAAAPTVVVFLLRRYPHQTSTRPHTGLHTRPTHLPSKEFRLHSLNHLQEFRLKLLIPFQELRLDSRLRAFGPRALRPLRLTPSRVRTLPHPGSMVLYYTSFKIQHDPACVLTMCGNPPGFFFYFFIFCSRRLVTYLRHVVSLHQ